MPIRFISIFFFFNDTATTEIYTLSLHDALPICLNFGIDFKGGTLLEIQDKGGSADLAKLRATLSALNRSEEHTSELQSPDHLVCRLLLEKKKENIRTLGSQRNEERASLSVTVIA